MKTRLKIGFVSLGCPKNLVDTENMMSALAKSDVTITGNEKEADIVVINTCGFLDPAKKESMSTIAEFVELKKKSELKSVIVAGCMTERYLDLMKESYPEVDSFVRTGEFSKIASIVDNLVRDDSAQRRELVGEANTEQLAGHSEMNHFVKRLAMPRAYAYVKISEGCNRVCSFCIIPKLRGKHHSRSIEGVVDEIKQLVASGTQEIIFIAQDLTSYGRDLKDGTNLLELLKEVEKIEGLFWFRLMYNYPRFFTDDLIDFLASSEKFSGYLDIPFQHISDSVLKQMKRPESSLEIKNLISKLRERLPRLSLRTTLMVGFPGETESDFQELVDFVKEAGFQHMGAFPYYREPNTPSYDLENQVSEESKTQRLEKLMEVQKKVQRELLEAQLGTWTEAVVDAFAEKTRQGYLYRGRSWAQAPDVDGVTYILSPEQLEVGEVVAIELERIVGDYDFSAKILYEDQLEENLASQA